MSARVAVNNEYIAMTLLVWCILMLKHYYNDHTVFPAGDTVSLIRLRPRFAVIEINL